MRRMDTSNQLNSVSQNHRDDCCACVCATADGNQTTVKTATGIWNVEYNGENRPVKFTQGDTIITMDYDYMGRRFAKTVNGNTQLFVYDNYLQIAELNEDSQIVKSYIWDPTAGYASRPLATTIGNDFYYYTHDANKNITELIASNGTIVAHYEYSPFGAITGQLGTLDDPFTFSSEYLDKELGLMYYNYRHYNPTDGRWISRDPIEEQGGWNLYEICYNQMVNNFDLLGRRSIITTLILFYIDKFLREINPFYDSFPEGPYLFEDEENEMLAETQTQILKELRNRHAEAESTKGEWVTETLSSTRIDTETMYANSSTGMTEIINGAHKVEATGSYAWCKISKGGGIAIKDIDLYMKWYDEMDANSVQEIRQWGRVPGLDEVEVLLDWLVDWAGSFEFIIQYKFSNPGCI